MSLFFFPERKKLRAVTDTFLRTLRENPLSFSVFTAVYQRKKLAMRMISCPSGEKSICPPMCRKPPLLFRIFTLLSTVDYCEQKYIRRDTPPLPLCVRTRGHCVNEQGERGGLLQDAAYAYSVRAINRRKKVSRRLAASILMTSCCNRQPVV